jgi:hypothetical protein
MAGKVTDMTKAQNGLRNYLKALLPGMGSNLLDAATKTVWDAQALVNPLRIVVMTKERYDAFEAGEINKQLAERFAERLKAVSAIVNEEHDTLAPLFHETMWRIRDALGEIDAEEKEHRDEYKGGA